MKWVLVFFFLIFIVKFSFSQCDSLKTSGLRTMAKYVNPSLSSLKFSFDPIGEDSTSYVYGRCPWEGEPKCLPFQEFFFISKQDLNFRYFQCYNVNTFNRIKSEIIKASVTELLEGKNLYVWESMYINFLEQELIEENPCNVKRVYTIEFKRKN